MAARLWLAAELLADESPGGPEAYEERSPAIARERGDDFAARPRQAASELRDDIEAGRTPTPRAAPAKRSSSAGSWTTPSRVPPPRTIVTEAGTDDDLPTWARLLTATERGTHRAI